MKIGFFSPIELDYSIDTVYKKPLGGTQSALCYLAEKIAENGIEVFLFNNISEPIESRNVICLPLNEIPSSLLHSLNVLIMTDGAHNGNTVRSSLPKNIPLILWIQHDIDQPAVQSLSNVENKNSFDAFVFISDWQRNRYIEKFKIEKEKTTVLRNAISPFFQNLFEGENLITASKLPKLTLAYTSTPFRGLDILLETFPLIRQEIPNLHLKVFSSLKVYGKKNNESDDQKQFGWLYKKCHDTEGVEYIGAIPQKQLAEELKSVTVFAYPNTFPETSCIALMEAMASGCYVVTSNLGALSETAEGFADLIPVDNNIFDDQYKKNFINKTIAGLKKFLEENNTQLEQDLQKQVQFFNNNYTWSIRAKEWVNWLCEVKQEHISKLSLGESDSNILNTNSLQDVNKYFYLGLAYLLTGDMETADSVWMSILLAEDNLENGVHKLLQILDQEGVIQIQKHNFNYAINIYYKINEILVNEEFIKPEWGLYYYHFGLVLEKVNSQKDAIQAYQKAVEINPYLIDAYNNLGNIYLSFNQLEQAQLIYQEAIKVNPSHSGSYFNLFLTLKQLGKIEDALKLTEKAVELFPDDYGWQLQKNLFLPIIYRTEEEILFYRKRFTEGLNNLIENLDLSTELKKENALNAISNHTNFYLAYQGYNDIDLQKKYASLVSQITQSIFSYERPLKNADNGEDKIKLGFVTGGSSNRAKWLLKWLEYLKGDTFTIYVYIIEDISVNLKQNFEAVTDFCYFISNDLKTVCDKIYQDKLDILTYTEIGMLPQTIVMGSLKLAPIQCSTIGHPLTSGLETIDYYISRELMEIYEAQNHYSEKLFCLPNIGMYLEKESFFTVNKCRSDFNLGEYDVIYLCSQMLFKYLPQYDYLFAEIALQVSNAKFVFLESYPYLTKIFRERLDHIFSQRNLNYQDYCLFLPSLSQNDYFNLNLLSDVFLDSLAWSGDNTTREAIAFYLPIVTYPTELMRGRHSYGILKMLYMEETIANSEEEYINIAVKLGQDQNWRQKIKEKIKANIDLLYNDLECVRALEKFYRDFCYLHK